MKTSLGIMNGNDWEEYCHKLLAIRYPDQYQQVPAQFGGDYGIEGFIRDGIVFQCYCPDEELTGKDLYEAQRDKITRDINKLTKNAENISALGAGLIRDWRFLTPKYNNRELLAHCRVKETEVRAKGLPSIHPEFEILILNEDEFIPERAIYLAAGNERLQPVENDVAADIDGLLASGNEIVTNINTKLRKLGLDEEIHKALVEEVVRGYVIGKDELEELNRRVPDAYRNVIRLKQSMEQQLRMRMLAVARNGDLLERTLSEYSNRLERDVSGILSSALIDKLSSEAISDWLGRCPLDFPDGGHGGD